MSYISKIDYLNNQPLRVNEIDACDWCVIHCGGDCKTTCWKGCFESCNNGCKMDCANHCANGVGIASHSVEY